MAEGLTQSKAVIKEQLTRVIASGKGLRDSISENIEMADPGERDSSIENLAQWDRDARALLESAFTGPGPASRYPAELNREYLTRGDTLPEDMKRIRNGFDTRLIALKSIMDRLGLYGEPSETIRAEQKNPVSRSPTSIFIVHGRAEVPRQRVQRFLETGTKSKPIILQDEVKGGAKAIIEKLEEYKATAKFVIVLLTGDDQGSLADSPEGRPRARQNVVFELGFFIGALGRSRVAILCEEDLEIPSDINGILYIILDPRGAWKMSLAKELREAGIPVDLNRAE